MIERADDPHLQWVQDLIDKGESYKLHECAGYKWVGSRLHELHTIGKSRAIPHPYPYRGDCSSVETRPQGESAERNTMGVNRKFLKPKQIAGMFGISYWAALKWAEAGRFGAFKVGNRWFFVESMVPDADGKEKTE